MSETFPHKILPLFLQKHRIKHFLLLLSPMMRNCLFLVFVALPVLRQRGLVDVVWLCSRNVTLQTVSDDKFRRFFLICVSHLWESQRLHFYRFVNLIGDPLLLSIEAFCEERDTFFEDFPLLLSLLTLLHSLIQILLIPRVGLVHPLAYFFHCLIHNPHPIQLLRQDSHFSLQLPLPVEFWRRLRLPFFSFDDFTWCFLTTFQVFFLAI